MLLFSRIENSNCIQGKKVVLTLKRCVFSGKPKEMNNQQPIYLLAGGRGKTIFSSFKEMGKVFQTLGQKPVIAVVGVASLKDNRLIYGLMALLLEAYPDGRIEACVEPSARFVKTNGEVERQPDLLPGK
jgi:hypothetical protein